MEKKLIYLVDAVLLVGTLATFFFVYYESSNFVSFSPNEELWLFKYENCLGGDCWVFVDVKGDFAFADEYYVSDGLKINFLPGTYYWKLGGTFENQEAVKIEFLDEAELYFVEENGVYYVYTNNAQVELKKSNLFGGFDE